MNSSGNWLWRLLAWLTPSCPSGSMASSFLWSHLDSMTDKHLCKLGLKLPQSNVSLEVLLYPDGNNYPWLGGLTPEQKESSQENQTVPWGDDRDNFLRTKPGTLVTRAHLQCQHQAPRSWRHFDKDHLAWMTLNDPSLPFGGICYTVFACSASETWN